MLRNAPARVLLVWLVLLTFYRMWASTHLDVGASLYVDEAQYWTWAQSLDWGYFSKPPLIAWLIAASTSLFGDGLLAVRLPSLLLYPATAWLCFCLGERLYGQRIGWRIGMAISLMPVVSALGLFISTDAPLLFCWAWALLALDRALESNQKIDWASLGLAVGLGIMSKYTMAAFAACLLLFIVIDRQRWPLLKQPGLWFAAALATLIVLPNILWNVAHDFPTLRHTADITHVDGMNNKTGNALEFIGAQIASLGPLFTLAFLFALVPALRAWRENRTQFLLAFCLPLLGLVLLQALRSEANGNWAAPALLTACMLAVVWLSQFKLRWWLIALSINIALMLTAYHWFNVQRLLDIQPQAKGDWLKRLRGWDELAQALRPHLNAHPNAILLTDNRTLMAHLQYGLRDQVRSYAAWAPNDHPQDHYQLKFPLRTTDREIILISQNSTEQIRSRFTESTPLATIHITLASGIKREVHVFSLRGFMGYLSKP